MQTLENQATELAGEAFNIFTSKGEVLFDRLGPKVAKLPLVNTAPVKVS